jgi:hypothetical protein
MIPKGAYLPHFPTTPLPIDPSERPAICLEEFVYNFAFGSNMGPEKLKARAGLSLCSLLQVLNSGVLSPFDLLSSPHSLARSL